MRGERAEGRGGGAPLVDGPARPVARGGLEAAGLQEAEGRPLGDRRAARREKDEAEPQKQADRHWKPLLEKWRAMLANKDPAKRDEAEEALAEVTDPRAVPMVWAVFATGDEARQRVAVQVLGQIDAAAASRALAMLAVFSQSAEVRRIGDRDARASRPPRVRQPARSRCSATRSSTRSGPSAGRARRASCSSQGKKANLKRLYSPPPVPNVPSCRAIAIGYDADGLPVVVYVEGIVETGRIHVASLLEPASRTSRHCRSLYSESIGSSSGRPRSQARTGIHKRPPGSAPPCRACNAGSLAAARSDASTDRSPASGLEPLGTAPIDRDPGLRRPVDQSSRSRRPDGRSRRRRRPWSPSSNSQNDVAAIDRYNEPIERDATSGSSRSSRTSPARTSARTRAVGEVVGRPARLYPIMPQKASDDADDRRGRPAGLPAAAGPRPARSYGVVGYHRMSCFGAGTLGPDADRPRPIESLKVGDRVLTQDTKTGALGYQPILAVHHNPPSTTFRITLGGETIVSSQFHRFWKAGQGWVMARDLKAGDPLRTLGGLAGSTPVETGDGPAGVQPRRGRGRRLLRRQARGPGARQHAARPAAGAVRRRAEPGGGAAALNGPARCHCPRRRTPGPAGGVRCRVSPGARGPLQSAGEGPPGTPGLSPSSGSIKIQGTTRHKAKA